MNVSDLVLDADLVENGKWFDFRDGGKLRICYMQKKAYRNKVGRLIMKATTMNRNRDIDQVTRDEAVTEAMAGTILTEFKGFDANGNALPVNDDTIRQLLSFDDIRDFVMREAGDSENFTAKKGDAKPVVVTPEARAKSGAQVPA